MQDRPYTTDNNYFIDQKAKFKGGEGGDFHFPHERINNSPYVIVKGQ